MDDYAIINVAPSVVPEYFPSVRVFTYNVTGAAEAMTESEGDTVAFVDGEEDGTHVDDHDVDAEDKKKKKKKGSKRKHGHK